MKKFLQLAFLVLTTLSLSAQVRFIGVKPSTDEIIIKNFGSTEVDIQQYRLCALFDYEVLSSAEVALIDGSFLLAPGETVTITWNPANGFNTTTSDLGLYLPFGSYEVAANMVDFMQYGSAGQGRENVAVTAGLWAAGTFLSGTGPWVYSGENGVGNGVDFWAQSLIEGCTAVEACNYNPLATIEDGSCTLQGESCDDGNTASINDVLNADCVCVGELGGCTDVMACNYDVAAAFDDGNCYFTGDNCDDGNVFTNNDVYGADCVCLGEEIVSLEGCTAMEACNYNPAATIEDGSCTLPGESCDDGNELTLFDTLNSDCVCEGSTQGCTDDAACNYDPTADIDDSSCHFEGEACDDNEAMTIADAYNADCVCVGDPIVEGCTNNLACNYNSEANVDDDNCHFTGESCNDENEITINDVYGADCICAGVPIVEGCMNSVACNFNPEANVENGSCQLAGDTCDDNNPLTGNDTLSADCICAGLLFGCTNALACNYSEAAGIDDGSCILPGDQCNDNNLTTDNDVISEDCTCAGEDNGLIAGCVYAIACNYNSLATIDDGTCTFPGSECDDDNIFTINDAYGTDCVCSGDEITGIAGCTDSTACNFVTDATIEDGSCSYPGNACNDNNPTTDNDIYTSDCECAGTDNGLIAGCMDMMACNYVDTATVDNGSCLYTGTSCDDGNIYTINDTLSVECTCIGDSIEIVPGCTNNSACNYNANANLEDGTCQFPGFSCDDSNSNTVNDSLAFDCSCVGDLLGCTDALACNYNASASANDGSCTYPGTPCDDGIATTINDVLGADCSCGGELISILEIVVASPDHNTLEAAVVAAGLQSAFAGPGLYTLFAPTDAAFAALPAGTLDNLLADPSGLLSDVLLYHAVNGVTLSNELSNGMVISTIQGQDVLVTINTEGVFINNAKVIIADIIAENGVIHVIDAVLVPVLNPNPATVLDIIVNSPDHTTLEQAVIAAGLDDDLSGEGPFTVFAPTDAAFNALPSGVLNNLLADPTGALAQVLLYHVAAGQTYYNSLYNGQTISTLLSQDVTVTITGGNVFINNSLIILANLEAANGIVHVIDAVLTPVISVEETLLDNSTIYPNPAINELYVSTPSINGGGSYSIFSATGSLIEQGNLYSSSTRIDINELSQGMYQLKLVYGNECITRSFMKQ